jgi:hypothetical protein
MFKSPHLAQQLIDNSALPGQLLFILHVLELAAATRAEDTAGRLSSQR